MNLLFKVIILFVFLCPKNNNNTLVINKAMDYSVFFMPTMSSLAILNFKFNFYQNLLNWATMALSHGSSFNKIFSRFIFKKY